MSGIYSSGARHVPAMSNLSGPFYPWVYERNAKAVVGRVEQCAAQSANLIPYVGGISGADIIDMGEGAGEVVANMLLRLIGLPVSNSFHQKPVMP
jgi:hypothetical protein